MICLLLRTDPKQRKGVSSGVQQYIHTCWVLCVSRSEPGGTGHGATSWTNIVIIYNKNHDLFMAESRLSRFQTAGKAKLPDAACFFLIIKHQTLLL